jgi:hypothetical protein
LWAAAGDLEGECYLFHSRDGFRTIRRFGNGTQMSRAVSLFFTESHVSFLTDSEIEQNHACRIKRSTGELETGQPIDCPGWYGTTTREGICVAFTTVETGAGVKTRESCVLISDDAFHWTKVMTFKKDAFRPMQLFKYGVISCPSGELSLHRFWISGEGLIGLDGTTLQMEIRC